MKLPRLRRTRYGVLINGRDRTPSSASSSRQIHFVGRLVVKVDKGAQNWKEWRAWTRRIRPEDRRYFAPVLVYRGARDKRGKGPYSAPTVLVQPRFRFRAGRPSNAAREIVARLADRYGLDDVNAYWRGTRDVKNWGVTVNGRPVIFDYAL